MVDSPELFHFKKKWSYSGEVSYDPHTKKWSVDGSIYLKGWARGGRIPHDFDVVTGWFDVSLSGLFTLEGAPRTCRMLEARGNPLKNLDHAPKCEILHVQNCPDLENLDHMPELDKLEISWIPKLPMLRCLKAKKVIITPSAYAPLLNQIFNDPRWAGTGKSGVLLCAMEMKKQGAQEAQKSGGENPFLLNAKW